MSYYVHGAHGWLLTVALMSIGVSSLALTIGLATLIRGKLARLGLSLLAFWSIGTILGGTFPADPPGNWDKPPTVSGTIHGIAAIVAITAFPPAAVLISRSVRSSRVSGMDCLLTALAVASVASFIAFLGSLLPVFLRPGPPVLLGLTERILLAVCAAWLAAVAITLSRLNTRNSE
jgi:hypothetical protein